MLLILTNTKTSTPFYFDGLEIPESIEAGGEQRLSVHELVGGGRMIDAMGRSDQPMDWGGMFLGSTAMDRARYLDGLRIGGVPQRLSFSAFTYIVLVRRFSFVFQREYQIPYRISCEVVQDLTTPVTVPVDPPIDDLVNADATTASALSSAVGDSALAVKMSALQTAISAVSSFAKAAQSTINGVLQPLNDARAQVAILISATASTINSVTTLGGVLPNNPIAQQAGALTRQLSAMSQLTNLQSLSGVLGRMAGNLGSAKSSAQTVATAGGNLFDLSRKQYGGAMDWTGIARANGLTDPFIQGAKVLNIPPRPDGAGGVLGA